MSKITCWNFPCAADNREGANFCYSCGFRLKQRKPPKVYVGEHPQKGIYQFMIAVTLECDNIDEAEEILGKTSLYEDYYLRDLDGTTSVELLRSTVPKDTHPFVCGTCSESDDEYERDNALVSMTDKGHCEWCEGENWIARTEQQ